jgi:plasmid stabilization system protein ParE
MAGEPSRTVEWTEAALADLREIAGYTAARYGTKQVVGYVQTIRTVADGLAKFPALGGTVERWPALRRLQVHQHILYYEQPSDEIIVIRRVLHGARDIDAVFLG